MMFSAYPVPNPKSLFDWTVSTTNIVALLAVAVSLVTLILSARKDRLLRRTQYADQIRNAAALLTAKLERWCDLAFSIFEDLQPAITDADVAMVEKVGKVTVRDRFWRDLGLARIGISKKILDEQIHTAYAPLYGYDAGVRELFLSVLERLKRISNEMYRELAVVTQREILLFTKREPASGELGNQLREVCSILAKKYARDLRQVLVPFRGEMIKIIEADDDSVTRKSIRVKSANELLPYVGSDAQKLDLGSLTLAGRHKGDWPMALQGITFHEWSATNDKKE
jgi:hypothetical protein